jgi:uncharacterized membrane protein
MSGVRNLKRSMFRMDLDYFRNILVIFLSVFFFLHTFVRSMDFSTQVQMAMLAGGLYCVFYVVKHLSGAKK